jgi:hypothetical protein
MESGLITPSALKGAGAAKGVTSEILMLTRRADDVSRSTSINPRALFHIANSLIMVHNQQANRQGTYQNALDLLRAPRIISTNGKSCGHKKAAKEAATQEYIISTIDEFP